MALLLQHAAVCLGKPVQQRQLHIMVARAMPRTQWTSISEP